MAATGPLAELTFEALNAPLLRHFPDLVRDLGGDPVALYSAARIGSDRSPDSLTYGQAIRLLEAAARDLACPDFGMRLATRRSRGGVVGPLGEAMRHSATYGDALRLACAHSAAHSRAARVWQRQIDAGGAMFAGHDLLVGSATARMQAIELVLLAGHLDAMQLTGGGARARCVHFRHEPVSPRDVYRRQFRCEVRFGEPADGITFWREDLDRPIVGPSPGAYEDLVDFIERTFPEKPLPVEAEVRGLIGRRLVSGECTGAAVAQAMHLHERTLRRRLAAEGSSFQAVKDDVRRELAHYYLSRTGLEFHAISDKLGFAEQSIFTRRCRVWFGAAPSRIRRDLAGRD